MSVIGQISGSIYSATYEPKSANARESKIRRDERLKDSVALSNRISASSSDEKNISVLKKMVDSRASIRSELVNSIKMQIDSGQYSLDGKLDKITDSIINSMFA